MSLWTRDDAVAATGGTCAVDWQANGVSIDTRTLQKGDLFVALSATRDGHDFVAQALEKGAAAALVSHIPEGVADDAPLLIVPDVLKALEAMAIFARARTKAQVVGVTGSVGKTSTKEMLRSVLARQGQVFAAERSFNNHWGVPLTLARMPESADFAIIEIGMNHPGEIAPLAGLARLHVAMITTVAAAHMEAFDGIEGIAVEKASIFDGLETGGVAVVNGDLETSPILTKRADALGVAYTTFGEDAQNTHRLLKVQLAGNMTVVRGQVAGDEVLFKINSPGRHFAMNGLGVLAVIKALDLDVALAANDMARWQPPKGRGSREIVVLDAVETDQALTLIDDAFNASPTSLDAALNVLAASQPANGLGQRETGRRIAILGDMLELGEDEAALHTGFASHPAFAKITKVHCSGPLMRGLWVALPEHIRGEWFSTAPALAKIAHRLVDAGDVILVKGSKGAQVSLVVDAIRKLDQTGEIIITKGAV